MNILINLLANNGYIIVNKAIIKKLGLHEAIILGELCSEYTYWDKNNKLDNGYFFSTRENIEENTGLTPYQQRIALAKLEKMGIVLVKSKGMPLQKWYSLNMDLLFEILKDKTDLTTSSEETLHHVVKKLDINNNNNNNKKNNNEDDNADEKKSVHITEKQYNNLIKQYGKTRVDKTITRLDLYKKSTGKKYEDDYSTILLWIDSDIEKENKLSYKSSNIDIDGGWTKNAKEKFGDNFEGLYANKNIFGR